MASYEAALTSARTEATSTSETTAVNEMRVMALERALADAEEECARARAAVDRDEVRSKEQTSFVIQARIREG